MLDFEYLFNNTENAGFYVPGTVPARPFLFVTNVSDLVDCDSIEVIPGRLLRRAEEEEIKVIKKIVKTLLGDSDHATNQKKSGSIKTIAGNLRSTTRSFPNPTI